MQTKGLSLLLGAACVFAACSDTPSAGDADVGDVTDARTPTDVGNDTRVERPDVSTRDEGRTDESDVEVEDVVENQAPVANAGDDQSGFSGRPITFDGAASVDADGEIVRYEWQTGDGATLSGATPSYTYRAEGVYVATLTVTDNDGASATDDVVIDLVEPNNPPVAIIRREFSGPVVETQTHRFTAADSTDDVAIARYEWNTGILDAPLLEDEAVDIVWPEWGSYELTLTVYDTDGEADDEVRVIDVLAPPTAVLVGPRSAFVGQEAVFDGTESFDRDNEEVGAIVTYEWDFGDGSAVSNGPFPRHTWSVPGDYDVDLTVTDIDGLTHSTRQKMSIDPLPNVPPVATIRVDRAAAEDVSIAINGCEELVFSAASSVDPDNEAGPVAYEWSFGDGTTLPGVTQTKRFTASGVFVVELTVTDSDGATDSATFEVTVNNVAPVADFSVTPLPIPLGSISAFDAGASTDCEGGIVRYRWDFGNDVVSSVTTATTNHTYAEAGIYNVTLEVEDSGGLRSERSRVIEVTEVVVPPSYSDTWTLDQNIAYTCAFGLVSINFSRVTIADTNPTIRVQATSAQPGSMSGTWSRTEPTSFSASNAILGGCDEFFDFSGVVESPDRIRYTFRTNFVGSCFGCTGNSWTGTMTR